MKQAQENLPFSLQQNISPEQFSNRKQIAAEVNQRYISSMCRAGPLSDNHLSLTDPFCLIFYLLLLISTLILFFINLFSGKIINDPNITQLGFFSLLAFSLNQSLPEIIISCACLIAFGIIILGIVILLPVIAGFFIILCCLGLLILALYSLLNSGYFQIFDQISSINSTSLLAFRIALIIVVCLAIIAIFILIFQRIKKLKHLGSLMSVAKIVLFSNFPMLPFFILFIMSIISVLLWCGFTKLIWSCAKMSMLQNLPIYPPILLIMALILWIWSHGFIISISDYICESWVLHWYFNANADEREQQNQGQAETKKQWKSALFGKLLRYHLGTCIFGSFLSAYISESFIKFIRKICGTANVLGYLTRYAYIETVMEGFSYCESNKETFYLRQRIKSKTPQIYMLGHFIQEILKIALVISGFDLWLVLSSSFNGFITLNISYLSLLTLVILCILVALGVFLQISTYISHTIGIISDTAVIAYSIDCQIQRVHYHNNQSYSCPTNLKAALMELQIDVRIQQGGQYNIKVNNMGNENDIRQIDRKYPNLHSYYQGDKSQIAPYYLASQSEV